MRRRVQHVKRFAATCGGLAPWHVEQDDYQLWIQRQVSSSTVAALRDSLRAFYRWAVAAGRIADDPTVEPIRRGTIGKTGPGRALGVPELWRAPLAAWRRYLIGSGAAATTVQARLATMETFARAHASLPPFDVTQDDIHDYMAAHARWARETRRVQRASLRAFFTWAATTGRMDADPTEVMPKVKAGDPVARPATDDEYRAALRATNDPRWKLALRMGCELGMRRSEVAQVHASDLRREGAGWWLTVHGKGGKVRRIPVPDSLAALMHPDDGGYLFPSSEGRHMTPRHVGKQVGRLLPEGVTMHALRHSFATRAYSMNRDVFTLQRLLGHASASTTQRYVQISDERLREMVEAVAL
ncbi:Site-specific recombinase XerD [Microbacterium sp. RU33B]|nr:Site-specific recombinase XerD [Microbacterium sp. RU33B]